MKGYLTTEDTENRKSAVVNLECLDVDGALIIDKPAGITSHDVVAQVRRIIGERRVGHTGTLDPFATGVLVLLIGRATRLAQFLSGAEKEYEGIIRLGYATDTGDVTGARVEGNKSEFHAKAQSPQSIREEDIDTALASLRGEIDQTPPMYSARKVAGQKLYELARRGEEIERKSVRVTVSQFEVLSRDTSLPSPNEDGTSDLAVRVVCSAGTYVRSLAEAVGQRLGVGAHLASLRRTRAGEFQIKDAVSLEQLNELTQSDSIEQTLISPDAALRHLPAVQLTSEDAGRVGHGMDLQVEEAVAAHWSAGQFVRMRTANGELIAVGVYNKPSQAVHPRVVIVNQ